MSNTTVLLVEDEPLLADLLADYLRQANYQVQILANGDEVVDWVQTNEPAVIVLDLMLPGKDGLTICREIRAFSSVPILMATARVDEIDRLLGLELGADDYICKPYSPREVVARVKANLRRSAPPSVADDVNTGVQLDDARYTVNFDGNSAELTAVEFQLFSILYSQPGRIFNRSQLMQSMYQDHRIVSDRTIDSHVRKIRNKLQDISAGRELIHSVYGVGYRFEL
ncbi:MAG: response regulator [Pseudomonadales bacterium]